MQYWEASEASRGANLEAASWFPDGCNPPALQFTDSPPPRRPPAPPMRPIKVPELGAVERGEIPVIELPVTVSAGKLEAIEPKARANRLESEWLCWSGFSADADGQAKESSRMIKND